MMKSFATFILILGVSGLTFAQLQIKNSNNNVVMHVTQTGEVGINTITPGTYKLRVNGSARTDALNINGAYNMPTTRSAGFLKADATSDQTSWADVFNGTPNRVAKFTGSGNTLDDSIIRDDGQRIGIGGEPDSESLVNLIHGLPITNELTMTDNNNTGYFDWVSFNLDRGNDADVNSGYLSIFTELDRDVNVILLNDAGDGFDENMNLLVDGHVGVNIDAYPTSWTANLQVNGDAYISTDLGIATAPEAAYALKVGGDAKVEGALYIANPPLGSSSPLGIAASGQIIRYGASSLRYKEDVKSLDDNFDKILSIEPKLFRYKNSGEQDFGVIAEELDQAGLNRLVLYDEQGRPDGVKYDRISLYLLGVVKSLKAEVEALKAKQK